MKHFIHLLYSSVMMLALLFVGCDKGGEFDDIDIPKDYPTLECDVEPNGESAQIEYELSVEIDVNSLMVESSSDWIVIESIDEESITAKIEANQTGKERAARITLSYNNQKVGAVVVSQYPSTDEPSGGDPEDGDYYSFEIGEPELKPTVARFEIVPSSDEATYIMMFITTTNYIGVFDSDDIKLREGIVEQYRAMAEQSGVAISEFLKDRMYSGTQDLEIHGLKPGERYYIVALGLTERGQFTSYVSKKLIDMPDQEFIDNYNFAFDINVEGDDVHYTITPDDLDQPWNYYLVTAEELAQSGMTNEQLMQTNLNKLIATGAAYGFDKEDVLMANLKIGVVEKLISDALAANTTYFLVAAAVDYDGVLLSDATVASFDTKRVEESENVISLNVEQAGISDAVYSVTTSNSDQYVVCAVPKSDVQHFSDDKLISYITGSLFPSVRSGNASGVEEYGLIPNTDYYLVAFGYESKVATTAPVKCEFKTLAAPTTSEVAQFSFTEKVENVGSRSADITITPSNDDVLYYATVVYANADEASVLAEITAQLDVIIKQGYLQNYAQYFQNGGGFRGKVVLNHNELTPGTPLRVYVVALDENTMNFASNGEFGETFTTQPLESCSVELTSDIDTYYKMDELAEIYPEYLEYRGLGYAMLPVEIMASGELDTIYSTIYIGDITDKTEYPDAGVISKVIGDKAVSNTTITDRIVLFNNEFTLIAVGRKGDAYTATHRRSFTLSEEGAAAASDFTPVKIPMRAAAPMCETKVADWKIIDTQEFVDLRCAPLVVDCDVEPIACDEFVVPSFSSLRGRTVEICGI